MVTRKKKTSKAKSGSSSKQKAARAKFLKMVRSKGKSKKKGY